MASFFSKIFGGGRRDVDPNQGDLVEHKGLIISPAPISDGGQWRLAGTIIKKSDQRRLEARYVRADVFPSFEAAEEYSVRKGKQIIDEQGERLFVDEAGAGRD